MSADGGMEIELKYRVEKERKLWKGLASLWRNRNDSRGEDGNTGKHIGTYGIAWIRVLGVQGKRKEDVGSWYEVF